jgi:hypothetical protein
MQDPWYSMPIFVVPVIWILFLSGIAWASQPWSLRRGEHNTDEGEVGGH